MNSRPEHLQGSSLTEQYRRQLDGGAAPDVLTFLASHPEATPRQCADVLLLDQYVCWREGAPRTAEYYLDGCPRVASDERLAVELITEEFGYRDQRGEEPTLSEYVDRFPQLREALADQLSEIDTSAQIAAFARTDAVLDTLRSTLLGETFRFQTTVEQDPRDVLPTHCDGAALLETAGGRLRDCMHELRFEPGEHLWRQGAPGDSLLVLLEGVVRITSTDPDGREQFIRRIGAGQVLGEMAVLAHGPRTADVIALSPVRALALPSESFQRLAREHPRIRVLLARLIATRMGHQSHDVLSGKTLNRYRIGPRLDRGGMSVVYQAEELKTSRPVALKMMSHDLVHDDGARQHFNREADLIESFDHPNICRMYGRFAAFHTYFIAMEFCRGQSLKTVLQSGPLPEEQVRRILGQVAGATAYAHASGVVHRDVKPSNIMLNPDGVAKLMDFGLARPLVDVASRSEGMVVGTPRYMAPEQAEGRRVGAPADLFGIGCVVYEMLTGEALFTSSDGGRLLRERAKWKPPNFEELLPGVEPALCNFLQQSLAAKPEEREVDLAELSGWGEPFEAATVLEQPRE